MGLTKMIHLNHPVNSEKPKRYCRFSDKAHVTKLTMLFQKTVEKSSNLLVTNLHTKGHKQSKPAHCIAKQYRRHGMRETDHLCLNQIYRPNYHHFIQFSIKL